MSSPFPSHLAGNVTLFMKRLLGCKTQQLTLCWLTDARLGVPLSPNPLFSPLGIWNGPLGSARTQGNVSPGLQVSYSAHLIDCQQVQSVWWRMTNCKKQCWPQCGVLNKLQSQAHIPQTHAAQQPYRCYTISLSIVRMPQNLRGIGSGILCG